MDNVRPIFVFKNKQKFGKIEEDNFYIYNEKLDDYALDNSKLHLFYDILPEGADLLIMRRFFNPKNDLELLRHLKNTIGDFTFSSSNLYNGEEIEFSDIATRDFDFPNEIKADINISSEVLFVKSDSKPPKQQNLSLSGYQHKLQAVIKNNTLSECYGDLILKPANDYENLAINEHLHTTFLKEFGFEVPYNGLIYHKYYDFSHYVVRRFDFDADKNKISQVSLNAFMQSSDKYDGTIDKIAKFLNEENCLDEDEKIKFLKYVFANALMFNSDFHKKNISFFVNGKNLKLTPAYDVINTFPITKMSNEQTTLPINGKKSSINIADIIEIGKKLGIKDENRLASELENMIEIYKTRYPEYLARLKDIKGIKNYERFFRKLTEAYETNVRTIQGFLITKLKKEQKNNSVLCLNIPDGDTVRIASVTKHKKFPPRPYQQECVDALMKTDRGIIYAPTGSGKTNIIAYLIEQKQETALIIVPAIDLVKQTRERLESILGDSMSIGSIDGNTADKASEAKKQVLVSTWQSIFQSSFLLKDLKGRHQNLIIDECHHASANVLSNIIETLAPYCKGVYGVSATPYRSAYQDQTRLMNLFNNNIAYRVNIEQLYDNGYLVRPDVNIIQSGSFRLNDVAQQDFIGKILLKKINDESIKSYIDFIDSSFKSAYMVISTILKQKEFQPYNIFKTMPNGTQKPIGIGEVENIKNFFKDCFSSQPSELHRKMKFIETIMLRTKIYGYEPNFDTTKDYSKDEKSKYLDYASRIFEVLSINHFRKYPQCLPTKWEDIGIKIGYLKKSIDEDFLRQREVEGFVYNEFQEKKSFKAIILTNSISWSKKIYAKFQDFKDKAQIFYLNGESKDKQEVFNKIRKLGNEDNFVLVSTTSLIKEGIDLPCIDTVRVMSPVLPPVSSIYSLEQVIGRAMRPFPGKTSADVIIFDALTQDFSNRREEIFKLVENNVSPKNLNSFSNMNEYIKFKKDGVTKDGRRTLKLY